VEKTVENRALHQNTRIQGRFFAFSGWGESEKGHQIGLDEPSARARPAKSQEH
jgi:hypothetical protein